MNPDIAPMHRLSRRFKNADVEASYVEEQERKGGFAFDLLHLGLNGKW